VLIIGADIPFFLWIQVRPSAPFPLLLPPFHAPLLPWSSPLKSIQGVCWSTEASADRAQNAFFSA